MLPWLAITILACGAEEAEVVAPPEPAPTEVVEAVAPELEMPEGVPEGGDDIAGGGLKDIPDPNAPIRPPDDGFNPVTIPQGRREGGVSWDGVKKKSKGNKVPVGDPRDGEFFDPELE